MSSEKKTNRSTAYQHLFCELMVGNDMLESYSNDESVYKRLNPHGYNEKISELEEKLRIEFWRLVKDNLTPRQVEVIKLISVSGLTQMEAAKILGVNQSSITKSLNGNVDYSKKDRDGLKDPRIYGGSLRKIKKLVQEDKRIQDILYQINELREETWV
jgi:predicted transcriptional regulator